MDNTKKILEKSKSLATAQGLLLLGATGVTKPPEFKAYKAWLAEGRHAGMGFMAHHAEARASLDYVLSGARGALVLALPYGQGDRYRPRGQPGQPRVAQYARLRDYHRVLKAKATAVATALFANDGAVDDPPSAPVQWRVVVDTAPVLERALAARAGQAFIGKNTCLIHPRWGSWLLLGTIVTTADLSTLGDDGGEAYAGARSGRGTTGGCGSCRRCQVHCPTGALDQDYRLDANLCLSYWTIEHRGTIPERFWPWLAQYYYGCDICQLVCPYNRAAPARAAEDLVRLRELPSLPQVATMQPADYERWFGGTPMTRAKRSGLMRNALIALTVTKDPQLEAVMAELAGQVNDPVVQDTLQQIQDYLLRQSP